MYYDKMIEVNVDGHELSVYVVNNITDDDEFCALCGKDQLWGLVLVQAEEAGVVLPKNHPLVTELAERISQATKGHWSSVVCSSCLVSFVESLN